MALFAAVATMCSTSLGLKWPLWSFTLLFYSTIILILAFLYNYLSSNKASASNMATSVNSKKDAKILASFLRFQADYLLVYAIIMLADWMQGTHMYTLYLSYDVSISTLFLTGFLSGAFFAPFLGSVVDRIGRRNSCVVYCVLEIVINVLESFNNMPILLVGRVLGGISTNLLFTSFESWMTTEHRKRGFEESWLPKTYSLTSVINGSTAVLAGIVAQLLEESFGQIGPFHGAVALTAIALLLILRWPENYGSADETVDKSEGTFTAVAKQFKEGWRATLTDSAILRIGLIQALSEGAMYTFVFMWVPTLMSLAPNNTVPTGVVFSALMNSITLGGLTYPLISSYSKSDEHAAAACYALAATAMAIPALCMHHSGECFHSVLGAFMLVEFSVGSFGPAAGKMRSKFVPDHLQGAILNIFRLPLNAFVVMGTVLSDSLETKLAYAVVCGWFALASALQYSLIGYDRGSSTSEGESSEEDYVVVTAGKPATIQGKEQGRTKATVKSPARVTRSADNSTKKTN